MSSLTINQEKQIRALKKLHPMIACTVTPEGTVAVPIDGYIALAESVREWRGLKAAPNTLEVREKRMALLKEIDRCLEALEEK